MIRKFSLLVLSFCFLTLENFALARTQTLPKYSHLFILERAPISTTANGIDQVRLFVQSLNKETAGQTYWMKFSLRTPPGKLYTNNIRFLLARPTDDYKLAHYIVLHRNVAATPDNRHYRQFHQSRPTPHRFLAMDKIIPVMRHNVPQATLEKQIMACPRHPKRANGEPCLPRTVQKLPNQLWKIIELVAKNYPSVSPELLAATVELETQFDPLLENEAEKSICDSNKAQCSPYRWGRGLGQFGKSEEALLDLIWDDEKLEGQLRRQLKKCRRGNYNFKLTNACISRLLAICSRAKNGNKFVFCPKAALRATALKLHLTLPKKQIVWREKNNKLVPVNIIPAASQHPNFKLRFRAGTYNRGSRTIASWENHLNTVGRAPNNYGELWSAPRVSGKTPSLSIGYSILRGEYINRCYVWRMAGLCGPVPTTSVISQYKSQYRNWRKNRPSGSPN